MTATSSRAGTLIAGSAFAACIPAGADTKRLILGADEAFLSSAAHTVASTCVTAAPLNPPVVATGMDLNPPLSTRSLSRCRRTFESLPDAIAVREHSAAQSVGSELCCLSRHSRFDVDAVGRCIVAW